MIVDSIALYREGLRRFLYEYGFQTIWCSDTLPTDLGATLGHQEPELLVIGTGLDAAAGQIQEVKRLYPSCRVVLLQDFESTDEMEAALDCGADSIVRRESSCEALHDTLRLVFDGVTVIPSRMLDALREARKAPESGSLCGPKTKSLAEPEDAGCATAALPDTMVTTTSYPASLSDTLPPQAGKLSVRELSVLQGLMEGMPNKQIARQLEITEATVKVHVKSILRKAGVRNRTQVAMWASHQPLASVTEGANGHLNGAAKPCPPHATDLPNGLSL